MAYIYIHLPQNEDIGFRERSYSVIEGLLEYEGRDVLYLLADASDISFCDRSYASHLASVFCDRSYASHLASVNVKGYVKSWKYGTNEAGEYVSEVESITDEEDKRAITGILRSAHSISSVNFF